MMRFRRKSTLSSGNGWSILKADARSWNKQAKMDAESLRIYVIGEEGILIELELAGFSYLGGPEDGGKKIELKPGYLMEHDKDIQALEVRLQQSEQAREKDLEEMHRQEEVLKKEMADMRQIDEIRMKEMEEIRQIEEVRKEYQDMMELVKRLSQSQFTPSQFPPPPP